MSFVIYLSAYVDILVSVYSSNFHVLSVLPFFNLLYMCVFKYINCSSVFVSICLYKYSIVSLCGFNWIDILGQ